MKKAIALLSISIVSLASCKKEDETEKVNVFYEINSSANALYEVKIIDHKSDVVTFSSVTNGWNWQRQIEKGEIVAIEATKKTLLDSLTVDFFRLTVGSELKQVSDTGKIKTVSLWAKIPE